jgi:hypothetical protein
LRVPALSESEFICKLSTIVNGIEMLF